MSEADRSNCKCSLTILNMRAAMAKNYDSVLNPSKPATGA